MIIVTDSHKLQYELANVVRLFFPAEEFIFASHTLLADPAQAVVRYSEQPGQGGGVLLSLTLQPPGNGAAQTRTAAFASTDHLNRPIEYGKLLYRLLCDCTGRSVDWGVLTGIRPVKLARKLREQGLSPDGVVRYFTEQYLTTEQKARLCVRTEQVQQPVIQTALPHGYSLYISVPFCPSRCSYCSFVSHSTEKSLRMLPDYLDKLCDELRITAQIAKQKGMVPQTVYMGGGTPTILSAAQLQQVLSCVREHFDLSHCTEFTVEAGRPDTITADKLTIMRQLGVDRLSVNCQTLSDEILAAVGRRHTASEFFEAFELVKTYGFTAVNVDLIAGLPGDTLPSFETSLRQVLALEPENITVHALTVKRAAGLQTEKLSLLDKRAEQSVVAAMVNLSQQLLDADGYQPYYLYRQKGTVDCLENVGFSKAGYSCLYNVFIMDETHTILSVGGGGVTKLVVPGADASQGEDEFTIKRIFNYKYPYEYLERFDTMVTKKQAILDFPL